MDCMFPNCDRWIPMKPYIEKRPYCSGCHTEIEIALKVMKEVIEVYPFLKSHLQFLTAYVLRFPKQYTDTRTPQYLYALKIANPPHFEFIMRHIPKKKGIRYSKLYLNRELKQEWLDKYRRVK